VPLIGAKVIVISTEEETEKTEPVLNKRRPISCTEKGNDKRYEALGNVIVKDDVSIIVTSRGASNTKVKCERKTELKYS